MTGNVKGKVAAVSDDAKTKAQKIADKATKATENMHRLLLLRLTSYSMRQRHKTYHTMERPGPAKRLVQEERVHTTPQNHVKVGEPWLI